MFDAMNLGFPLSPQLPRPLNLRFQSAWSAQNWLPRRMQSENFIIGGYTLPDRQGEYFGSLLVGYYRGKTLHYAGKLAFGIGQKAREPLHKKFQNLRSEDCFFSNLPTKRRMTCGQGISAAEMAACTWLEPHLVCQIKFSAWTDDQTLRQPVFAGLREGLRSALSLRPLPE